jgi:hypothetical protein
MKTLITIIFSFINLSQASTYLDDYSFITNEQNQTSDKHIEGILKVSEKSTGEEIDFKYDFYTPKEDAKDKLIVITPTIEGATPLEILLKDYLISNGFSVLIPHALPMTFTYDESTTEQFERASVRALVGTTLIVELLSQKENFDSNSIGLLGASLGGIRSSILFGLDHRFKAMFVAVAGADFPSVYANTDHSFLRDIRKDHMTQLGLTNPTTYENYLRERLTLDPSFVVQSPYLENVAMIISDSDKVVPSYNQWFFWSLIKDSGVHPKTFITQGGHVQGALYLLRYRKNIKEWFNEKL